MKKYAHISNGNVALILDYKMTSKFNENDIVEFETDAVGFGNFILRDGKIVVDNSTSSDAVSIEYATTLLNQKRDEELKTGVVVSDVFMNEDIIKTMAVQHNIATDDEVIEWIDTNNQFVTFNKVDFGVLIKQGSNTIKEIYFKYRKLKDELS